MFCDVFFVISYDGWLINLVWLVRMEGEVRFGWVKFECREC